MAGAGFTDVQRTELMQMIRDVLGNQFNQPGPPGEPSPPGPPGATGSVNGNGANDRFVPQDVGFFDPFYDGKSVNTGAAMEHTGKDTYFRDVHFFIDRITDVSRIKSDVVRQNFQLCFRGSALEWYTSELTDGIKRLLIYGNRIDEWVTMLRARFKASKFTGMAAVMRKRYTLSDAARRRKPREYAQTVIKAVKTTELSDTSDHLLIIWNGLDVEFQ